jgi:hypothetical protein
VRLSNKGTGAAAYTNYIHTAPVPGLALTESFKGFHPVIIIIGQIQVRVSARLSIPGLLKRVSICMLGSLQTMFARGTGGGVFPGYVGPPPVKVSRQS